MLGGTREIQGDGNANYTKEALWAEEAGLRDSYAPRRVPWLLQSVNASVAFVRS
ncbi:hypothetical protein AMP9_2595 [plant metagenome]|uniref:Uncharacterized protein n=1 Tax=plant metagenome TaxID=1297885 RepID=A0A484Q2H7_9ZZZZ